MNLGKERQFDSYLGVAECYVLGFNLTREGIISRLGYDPGTERNYTRSLPTGEKAVNVVAYLKEKTTNTHFTLPFFLEERGAVSSQNNMRYVNIKCQATYPPIPDWFAKFDHRQAYVGEPELLYFIKCWTARKFPWYSDDLDSGVYPLEENLQIFSNNLRPLNDLATRFQAETVGVLLGMRDTGRGLRQDVSNKGFVIGSSVSKVMMNLPTGISEKDRKDLPVDVRDFLKAVEGPFGYKGYVGDSYRFRKCTAEASTPAPATEAAPARTASPAQPASSTPAATTGGYQNEEIRF